jgi:SAM-dependent methyltransferase
MSAFPNEKFDAVVCYANPLGYVLEKRNEALTEVLRVLKRGGKAFFSMASLWGSLHELLPAVLTIDPAKNAEIVRVGGHRQKHVMCFRIETTSVSLCLCGCLYENFP